MSGDTQSSRGYFIVTGATNHIASDQKILINRRPLKAPVVFGAASRGSSMMAEEFGEAVVTPDLGEKSVIDPVWGTG
jgi:hypothetical protein